jgi:hypothetical protein
VEGKRQQVRAWGGAARGDGRQAGLPVTEEQRRDAEPGLTDPSGRNQTNQTYVLLHEYSCMGPKLCRVGDRPFVFLSPVYKTVNIITSAHGFGGTYRLYLQDLIAYQNISESFAWCLLLFVP